MSLLSLKHGPLFAIALLSACTKQNSDVDEYVERLENVLERNAATISTEFSAPFPQQRQLHLTLPPSELSVREFLSLRGCELHTTLAHRNSQLGKVSSASQKLFSDLHILTQGPKCVEQLGESELTSKLVRFLKQKQQNLNVILWHALLAQPEHASFWRSNISNNNAIDVRIEITSLSEFSNQVLRGKTDFSKQQFDDIERHLGRLRFGGGGQLLEQYSQLIVGLRRANSVIKKRLEQPLCISNAPTQKAHFFKNVVNKFFIKSVQRHAVKLNQQAKQLIPIFSELEEPLLEYSSADYKAWARKRKQLMAQGQSATMEHVKLLQKLYQQCGLMPT